MDGGGDDDDGRTQQHAFLLATAAVAALVALVVPLVVSARRRTVQTSAIGAAATPGASASSSPAPAAFSPPDPRARHNDVRSIVRSDRSDRSRHRERQARDARRRRRHSRRIESRRQQRSRSTSTTTLLPPPPACVLADTFLDTLPGQPEMQPDMQALSNLVLRTADLSPAEVRGTQRMLRLSGRNRTLDRFLNARDRDVLAAAKLWRQARDWHAGGTGNGTAVYIRQPRGTSQPIVHAPFRNAALDRTVSPARRALSRRLLPEGWLFHPRTGKPILDTQTGQPVFLTFPGSVAPAFDHADCAPDEWAARSQDFLELHAQCTTWANEHMKPALSLAEGRVIDRQVTVIDMNGVGIWKALMAKRVSGLFIEGMQSFDNIVNPEILERCYIINAPRLFSSLWAVARRVLPAGVQKKICIVSGTSESERVMRSFLAPGDVEVWRNYDPALYHAALDNHYARRHAANVVAVWWRQWKQRDIVEEEGHGEEEEEGVEDEEGIKATFLDRGGKKSRVKRASSAFEDLARCLPVFAMLARAKTAHRQDAAQRRREWKQQRRRRRRQMDADDAAREMRLVSEDDSLF